MLTKEALIDNDEVIQLCTALPNFGALLVLIQFLTSGLSAHRITDCFSRDNVKLRLNLEQGNLAYCFMTSQTTVFNIFHKWIVIMAK